MLLSPEEISPRCEAIRFAGKQLANAAGMTEHCAARTLSRRQRPTYDNVAALSKALTDEEIRLRDYLLGLHPVGVVVQAPAQQVAE